jgi:antitoxin ParD1/3/4
VEAGAYASESDLVRDALDALFSGESEPDPWFETEEGTRWLRGQVLPAYTDYMADPSRTIPMNEVFSGASERYMARKAARADKA